MQKSYESRSYELNLDELSDFATNLYNAFPKGVMILQGDLASGKTTLVKSICKVLQKTQNVNSPTFSIMQEYDGIFHYDLYRVNINQIMQNGLFENFFEDGLHIVEWGNDELCDKLKKYKIKLCIIKISSIANGKKYEVSFA